ncbi:hypothetical protein BJD55_gp076 [Gordonia phage Yvonnetastic]|uniref:HNH endonuclease n=1 Tax=Gordonia phage Yvonnetastic TaxID=1821566 RepID=A0A142K9A7_9CAUD|nr:hypothetical protein BJD55_gp076 [Gordonia phage Yvonnetastic]AMS02690.1 hypothetical protein SEA_YVONNETASTIC_146 [Gordonia phage Yvonnetastic]
MMMTKPCLECGLPLTPESRSSRKYCDECRVARRRERGRRYARRRYQADREAVLEYNRKDYANNRDKRLDYKRRHYLEHQEEYREYARRYREENLDSRKEYMRRYLVENPEVARLGQHRRRARKRSNGTQAYTFQQIWDRHQGICYLCHQACDRDKGPGYNEWLGTVDHAHPIWLGGADAPWNAALCCLGCNLKKGRQVLAELDFAWFTQRTRPDTLEP